jgi:hypothetical protein
VSASRFHWITGGPTSCGAYSQAATVEPIRVFLGQVDPPMLGEIALLSAGTKVKESPDDAARVELVSSKGKLVVQRLSGEEIAKQERELVGSLAEDLFKHKKGELHDLYERLLHTRHVIEITPQPERAMKQAARDLAHRLAAAMKGTVHESGVVTDPEGRRLFAPGQAPDPEGTLPRFESALKRRAATRALLATKGVTIPEWLPPILADEEVILRDTRSVVERCRGLVCVVGLASGRPRSEIEAGASPDAIHALLTRLERWFWDADSRDEQMIVYFEWQSEALFALLWALGSAGHRAGPAGTSTAGCASKA